MMCSCIEEERSEKCMYIELGLRSAPAINATVVFFCDDHGF
jgi:hypothetical protein